MPTDHPDAPALAWSLLTRDDLPDLAELYAACHVVDEDPERRSLVSLEEYWDSPRSVPEEDLRLGRDADGRAVAIAWAGCNRAVTERRNTYLGGAVHPDRRGEGIGRAVLAWEIAHVEAWDDATREEGFGPLVLRLYAPTGQADVRDLAERFGLTTERYFFEMNRPLGDDVDFEPPDGVRLVDWDPARSAEVHRVVDDAFHDHWGHVDRTEQMWAEHVGASAHRPQWSVLAVDEATGAVVGAAVNAAYEDDWEANGWTEGYTDELAVAASHRGRGIAGALLLESMRRFRRAGLDRAGLGVDADNLSGALRLYEGMGYRTETGTCVHTRTRP